MTVRIKLLIYLSLLSGIVSAQPSDSVKRPLITLQTRLLPPWVMAGGVEVYAFPRHSFTVIVGGGYLYSGSDGNDTEKFKTFDYRFYFGLSKKNDRHNFFVSPSLKLATRYYDYGEGYMSTSWIDDTAESQIISLLLGKRRYFNNNFNLEVYLGPSYIFRTTVERMYDEAEDVYHYNTYKSTFWNVRGGFSFGYTFYTRKKNP